MAWAKSQSQSHSDSQPESPGPIITEPIPTIPSVHEDPLVNSYSWRSPVPSQARGPFPCILGVDEAGRGPVLGPLVYAVAYCPAAFSDDLKKVGFADSKALTAERRDALVAALIDSREQLGWATRVISPQDISSGMLRRRSHNLNAQSTEATVELISGVLESGVDIAEIFVDTVGDPATHARTLKSYFLQAKHRHIEWTVTSKADAIYPIVGAASIAAKVTRDRWIDGWKYAEQVGDGGAGSAGEMGILQENFSQSQSESQASDATSGSTSPKKGSYNNNDNKRKRRAAAAILEFSRCPHRFWHTFGSGYPGDPNTVAYLHRTLDPVFGWPGLVRFSWATVKTLLEEKVRATPSSSSVDEGLAGGRRAARFRINMAALKEAETATPATSNAEPIIGPTGCRMPGLGLSKGYKVKWVDEAVAGPQITSFFASKAGAGTAKVANEPHDASWGTQTARILWQKDQDTIKKERVGLAKNVGLSPVGPGSLLAM